MIKTIKYKESIPKDKYCIDEINGDIHVYTCDQCIDKICVNLCCPFGEYLSEPKIDYNAFESFIYFKTESNKHKTMPSVTSIFG